jgi:hypothetical protein
MQLDTPAAALPVIVIARGKEISILSGEAIKTVSHNYSLWQDIKSRISHQTRKWICFYLSKPESHTMSLYNTVATGANS